MGLKAGLLKIGVSWKMFIYIRESAQSAAKIPSHKVRPLRIRKWNYSRIRYPYRFLPLHIRGIDHGREMQRRLHLQISLRIQHTAHRILLADGDRALRPRC